MRISYSVTLQRELWVCVWTCGNRSCFVIIFLYYLNELRAGWRDEGTIRKRGAEMRHYPFAINVKMRIALVTGVPYFNSGYLDAIRVLEETYGRC